MSSPLESSNPHGIRVVADRAPMREDVKAAFEKGSRKAAGEIRSLTHMPDLSDYEGGRRRVQPGKCLLGSIMIDMPDGERVNLEAALAALHITNAKIASTLSLKGWKVSDHTVRHHRAGKCACDRSS